MLSRVRSCSRSSEATVEGGVEQHRAHAFGGEDVAQRVWNSTDYAVEPKAAKVVGHRTRAGGGDVATEERRYLWTYATLTPT